MVYAQNPATFGLDHYLLTNPAGLQTLNEGFVVEMSRDWRALTFHGSLIPEESLGPTNPGDSVFENDPGIVRSLLMDPNTTQHATGRSFLDRAWEAKIQMTYRLPAAWSGIELDSTLDYLDGLVFGRELLVTGLPQGPFLAQATRRGWSPQGGYRSDRVVNWNLRLRRDFHVPVGTLSGGAGHSERARFRLQLAGERYIQPYVYDAIAGGGAAAAQFAYRGALRVLKKAPSR